MVLGEYSPSNNHPLGNENLKFTRIPRELRHNIEARLHDGMELNGIVCLICEVHCFVLSDVIFSLNRSNQPIGLIPKEACCIHSKILSLHGTSAI
jgi:hypothetical protein